MALAPIFAQGWGEALPPLLTEPTLYLPRDLLDALRNRLHSSGAKGPEHLTAGLRKLPSLYRDLGKEPKGSDTVGETAHILS